MTQIKIQTALSLGKSTFSKYASIAVLVDKNTRTYCYNRIKKNLPKHAVIEILSGEEYKTIDTCEFIWQQMTELQLDRHSLLIVIGGGVLGDMGGFCAATYKRGIDFILLPTTLLSQVDASIGGKLGVDFGSFKNHIGVFQLPVSTNIATDFLKTLPKEELRSGFAEIIKHCLIADKKMWTTISKSPMEKQNWLKLVKHSVKVKSAVVKKDPTEKGLRKVLNFGHTIGHAIEGYFLSSGNRLLHGEAIALGMIMESHIAVGKKLMSKKELESITKYILSVFGKVRVPDAGHWIDLIKQDKKNKGNAILMAVPKGIGKAVWDVSASETEIRGSLDYYRSYQI